MVAETAGPANAQEAALQMRQLDFLLGSVRGIGATRPDGAEPAVMLMRTGPILGGRYFQSFGTWSTVSIGRIFGWDPTQEVFTEYFFSEVGGHGFATSPGWQGDELVLTGSFAFAGVGRRTVRDVFRKVDEDHFTIDTHMSTDDRTTADHYACHRYERLADGNPTDTRPDQYLC